MLEFLPQVKATLEPLLEGIGEAVLVVDLHGKPVLWNAAAERVLDAKTFQADLGAWTARAGVFAVDGVTPLSEAERPLPRAIRGETVTDQELVVRRTDGAAVLVSCTARALRDASENVVGGVAIFRDIGEQRRRETAIRESERLYRTLTSHLPSAVVLLFDRDLRFTLAGGGGLAAAGLTSEQIEGRPIAEYATPRLDASYRAVFDGVSTDTEIERSNGRPYRVQLVPVRDEKGIVFAGLMLGEDITDQRRRDDERRQAEHLRRLAEAIPQIVWTSEPSGEADYYNRQWFDYTGMTLAQTKGWGWGPALHPDDLQSCVDAWTEAVRSGTDYYVESRFRRASDGAYRWHLSRALPVRDSGGAIVKWFGTCTDIDDQRRAQDTLLDAQKALEERFAQRTRELAVSQAAIVVSEARFRAAAEGMTDAFYILDAVRNDDGAIDDFRVADCNGAAAARFGRPREQVVGALRSTLVPWARTAGLHARFVRVLETGERHDEVVEIARPDAARAWLHLRIVPLNDGIAVTTTDVTERRRLDDERSLHAAVLTSIKEGVCLVRASDSQILYANPTFSRMLGYEDGELDGKPASVLRVEAAAVSTKQTRARVQQEVRENGMASYETTDVRKDGRQILCRATTTMLHRPEQGEVYVVVKEDITEKKRIEEERNGFFGMSLDLLCVAGFDGYFKQLNPAWERTMGWSLEELKAKPWLDFVHPDDRAASIAEGQRLVDGVTMTWFENRLQCKDGSYRILQWRAVPSFVHQVSFCTARDATDLRNAQDALHASLAENRAALLEKVVLLKEVHHRVKNNLQVISSLLKLHSGQITDPAALAAFQDSQDRVRAIALLHEQLYQSKDLGSVSITPYAEVLVQTLIRASARHAVRFTIDGGGIALPVDSAVPFGLILNELVMNSLKHAFGEENLLGSPTVSVELRVVASDLELIVRDNGRGFPAGFDAAQVGSLGMHIVLALTEQLGGKIRFTSHEGAESRLRFPTPLNIGRR